MRTGAAPLPRPLASRTAAPPVRRKSRWAAVPRWLITAAIVAVIAYGSLYPFQFHIPMNGIGPVSTFLATWNERPGRGDFLANILLYLPLGFFLLLGSERGSQVAGKLIWAVLAGAMLSLTIELTQY